MTDIVFFTFAGMVFFIWFVAAGKEEGYSICFKIDKLLEKPQKLLLKSVPIVSLIAAIMCFVQVLCAILGVNLDG